MTRAPGGDRAFALDAAAMVAISAAICTASEQLAFMSVFVPAVIALRLLTWPIVAGRALGRELLFFALCTGLGAFNDWSSVVRHRIYDYDVPHYFPSLSSIPLWMLLFWGLILRFLVSLFQWRRLQPPAAPRDETHLGRRVVRSAALKVVLQLALVFATRQAIYRQFTDPVFSWLPFALALVLYALLFRPDRHDRTLVLLFLLGGPLVEILYIQLGGLHRYQLGWLGGVPVWIALWWVLAVLIWKDLSARVLRLRVHTQVSSSAHAGRLR